jgi:hypothetical protein
MMKKSVKAKARARNKVTWETVREIGHSLPGVDDGRSYGTPALHAGKKLLARLREDGESVAVRTDFVSRDFLLRADDRMYFLTDHYRDYPWILVRLATARRQPLADLLEAGWRLVASKRMLTEFEARPTARTGRRPRHQ